MVMVNGAVLGAALGTGLALLAALTLIIYLNRKSRRKDQDLYGWGWDPSPITRPCQLGPPTPTLSKVHVHAKGKGKGKCPSSLERLDSRTSSTKSCPPTLFTYPNREFSVPSSSRIVQPTSSSLPQVCLEEGEDMLTHQSRSLPPTQLNRTCSISVTGTQDGGNDYNGRKGHRGSSPAIRTFNPDGAGVSPSHSPPLTYQGSRSPSPITNIRDVSSTMKGSQCQSLGSPSSSTVDLRSPTPSLSSLTDKTNLQSLGSFRRFSGCLSPLLIPPKSPTTSETSSDRVPLSPLLGTLQLDLYKKQDVKILLTGAKQAEPSSSSEPALGQLHFVLKYDFDKSDLNIHVIQAQDLALSSQGGFNDPYVRIFLTPSVDNRKRQTKIHRNEPNPYFDEHFKFPVSQDEMKDKVLFLQVFDYDRYSRNDVVGQVSFRLDEFDVTSNLDVWADVIKNKKPSGERQEILISLSYLPSAERLTVVLLKARNLYTPPNKDNLDPFVKVYLTGGGKRLKKKKTTARKNSKNPVWNEALSFSISSQSLANAALEICVLDQSNDLMGKSHALIGSCILGNKEDGSELSHWQEMNQNYRKSIAMWHVLT